MGEERRYPWTSAELFLKICENLKEKGVMPDNLAHSLPTSPQLKITTGDFRLRNNLWYGEEGIYLDVFLEFNEDGKVEGKGLGTFQTLDSDGEAMHTMAGLLADFIIELRAFTNTHQSDFIWEGVSLFPCDGSGERLKLSLCCDDMETALALKDQLLEKYYPVIEVRDNRTRKVEMYKRTENK